MKTLKRFFASLIVVVMLLTAAPLSGLVGLNLTLNPLNFFVEASANTDYSDLTQNQYMAKILLNHNYNGVISPCEGDMTIPQKQLDFYLNLSNASSAKILLDEILKNETFMNSVVAWEVLTFEPKEMLETTLKQEDYYIAILMSILDTQMKDSKFLDAWNCTTNKAILSISKSTSSLMETLLDKDISDLESVNVADLTDEQFDDLIDNIGSAKETKNLYSCLGDNLSLISDISKTCTTVYDVVQTVSTYSQIADLNKSVENVLAAIYQNCPSGTPMKSATLKVYNIATEQMSQGLYASLEAFDAVANAAFSYCMDKVWDFALDAALGSFSASFQIGQAIGKAISNFCFSTDAIVEQFYVLDAVYAFEQVFLASVDTLANKFKANESVENADNYMKAIELLFSLYDLDGEYTYDFVYTARQEGLYNTIKSWFGKDETTETYREVLSSMKGIRANVKSTLTTIEGYRWFYEEDAPTAYVECFGVPEELPNATPAYSKTSEIVNIYPINNLLDGNAIIFTYQFSTNKTVAIVGCDLASIGSLTIPKDIGGFVVNEISSYAFRNCDNLTNIIIPDSVTSIGYYSFYDCDSLTSITIPDSVTSIGQYAFAYCDRLASITIPDSVTSIDNGAFYNCTSLTNATIGNGVTSMSNWTFKNCTGLKILKMPASAKIYDSSDTFYGCTNIEKVTLTKGTGVMQTGNSYTPWRISDKCTEIVLEDGIVNIGSYAFYNCDNLANITIPNSVTSIGSYAFYNCNNLKELAMPASAKIYNSSGTFDGCTNIESVTLTKGTGTMQNYSSSAGDSNTCNKYTPWYISDKCTEIVLENGIVNIGTYAFSNCDSLTSITIPDSVTSIGQYAFAYCDSLTSTAIPDSVTSIEYCVFYNCTGLTSVAIPDSITSIGSYAFGDCDNLTSVTIPDSVTSIGSYAFRDCDKVTSITIPNSVTSIGKHAFAFCDSLTDIDVSKDNTAYSSINGVLFVKDKTILVQYPIGNSRTSYTIPNGVITIGEDAFRDCDKVTSITIPNSVTSIGQYAFAYCDSLTSITIPDSVTSINSGTFYNCTSLTNATVGNGVTSIGSYAFQGCNSLTDIYYTGDIAEWCTISFNGGLAQPMYYADNLHINDVLVDGDIIIPDSVTSIGAYAFYNCDKVTNITVPNSVTSIGSYAFYNCTSLKALTMPASAKISNSKFTFYNCTNIEKVILTKGTGTMQNYIFSDDYSNTCNKYTPWYISDKCTEVVLEDGIVNIGSYAFYNCDNLANITIPNSVTSIGTYAFYNCDNLTSVTIPDSVTRIGSHGYYSCDNLTSVDIGNGVISIGDQAFQYCDSLISITIPDSITSIGDFAFCDCYSLENIEVSESNTIYSSDEYGVLFNKEKTTLIQYPIGNIRTSYTIPDGVSSVNHHAFSDCTTLKTVVFPETLTSISKYAFDGCSAIETVEYLGFVKQWSEIAIADYNASITNADIVFSTLQMSDDIVLDIDTNTLSGLDSGLTTLEGYLSLNSEIYTLSYKTNTDKLGTNSKVVIKNGEQIVDEYTIIIFGDVNGDGWYDGTDAVLVSCLANGMLTKDDVSEAVYTAADCNHDGVIDEADVALLNQAGTLLANVDQTKPTEVLLETSSEYVEYISLIDQSPENEVENETDIPEIDVEETTSVENSLFAFIVDLIEMIKKSISLIVSIVCS